MSGAAQAVALTPPGNWSLPESGITKRPSRYTETRFKRNPGEIRGFVFLAPDRFSIQGVVQDREESDGHDTFRPA